MSSLLVFMFMVFFMGLSSFLGEVSAFMPSKKTYAAIRTDVPFIECGVCKALADHLTSEASVMHRELLEKSRSSSSKSSVRRDLGDLEGRILEVVENACDPEKDQGTWLTSLDMVEDGDAIKVVAQDTPGHCEEECKTVQRACEKALGDSDTDLAEMLYTNRKSAREVRDWLCVEESGVCAGKPPKVPATRKPGKEFKPKSEKDLEMDKLMRSMQGMPGMPGMQMFNRDDLQDQLGGDGSDGYDGYDDDGYGDEEGAAADDGAGDAKAKEGKGDVLSSTIEGTLKAAEGAAAKMAEVGKPVYDAAKDWWGRTFGGADDAAQKADLR
mmetsp:Transcript_873/g.1919  ORF Transcript_873/g.1919 Transcript_873/m.1919 type:complete len:326 (-) Transcript_873:484-1461(-)